MGAKFLYKELSYQLLGAAMDVHRHLGPGFLEAVYDEALAHELRLRRMTCQRQVPLTVRYKHHVVGEYKADYVVAGKLLVELKAIAGLCALHEAQVIHYLAATGLRVGLLVNFGGISLEYKRFAR